MWLKMSIFIFRSPRPYTLYPIPVSAARVPLGQLADSKEISPMTPSRLVGFGVLLAVLGLVPIGSAQQPGRGGKLPDTVKLEADIPYAGTDNARQRVNLLLP